MCVVVFIFNFVKIFKFITSFRKRFIFILNILLFMYKFI